MRIALIGPRGVGKTKISLQLARRLRLPLLSLDTLIAYDAGKSIPRLVKEDGWGAFRDWEFQALHKSSHLDPLILDCGGGVVVDLDKKGKEVKSERKIRLLQDFTVFFLDAPLQEIKHKILGDKKRPSLSDELQADDLLYNRMPWYQEVMDYRIPVAKGERKKASKRIVDIVEEFGLRG